MVKKEYEEKQKLKKEKRKGKDKDKDKNAKDKEEEEDKKDEKEKDEKVNVYNPILKFSLMTRSRSSRISLSRKTSRRPNLLQEYII